MIIHDIFATSIKDRIEPVVKVIDRSPEVILNEVTSLVVTAQWERHIRAVLDSYAYAATRDDEQGIGLWINGFFGSGKSLMLKVLGALLEGRDVHGQRIDDLFLTQLPGKSAERSDIERFLKTIRDKVTTTVSGGNLHALQANNSDTLALITFRLFAKQRGFTQNWAFAWAIEHQIDERGKTEAFRQLVSALSGADWEDVSLDPEFYIENLCDAAARTLPENFSHAQKVESAVSLANQNGLTPVALIERLRRWCAARDRGGRRHKLLIQLDELGQWIQGGPRTERAQQVQALIETAATNGGGRIWIAITAHGDVQELESNLQQVEYAKINQRFANKCKLSNEDINLVVEERLLKKNQPGRAALERLFAERSGTVADLGTVNSQRNYQTPDARSFLIFYPYLPWTVEIIPDVVKGVAHAAGREKELTGSNRTMIGVVQGAIIETPGLLDAPLGRLIALADLYDQIASDAPIETKTDLNRIRTSVPGATDFTPRVARALYLLTEAEYVPPTLDHVTRALVTSIDEDIALLRDKVLPELTRLVNAGYAKHVGDNYSFLSTQQRGFQDRVRARQEQIEQASYELSQALKEYEGDVMRFDRVLVQGRELPLKLEIDGRISRNPTAHVKIRVVSQFQKTMDTQISDDAVMKQRSNEDQNTIIMRLEDVRELRGTLALTMATDLVSNETISSTTATDSDKDIARSARQQDLQKHREDVRRLLSQSVRNATIFFRGTSYQVMHNSSAGESIRSTLAQLLPQMYPRLSDLPYSITDEVATVRAALAHATTHRELQQLGVYRADGVLNDAHPLISTLRARLPVDNEFQQFVHAEALRVELERPPFGWDTHSAKVGLALLLRASACRLLDQQKTYTDPNDPEVLQILTKEARFRGLRVQGVKSDLTMGELQRIRGYIETLFGVKPGLVQATLNTTLGDNLHELHTTAQESRDWAATARCPLPLSFESGLALVEELLNNANAAVRLPRFLEQGDTLITFAEVLRSIRDFRRDHGQEYLKLSDFFTRVVYAEISLDEVQRFINDWRTVTQERSITTPNRWQELVRSYHTADQAMTSQAHAWRQDAAKQLGDMDSLLEQRLRATGMTEEAVMTERATLRALLDDVRNRVDQPDLTYDKARSLLTALASARMNVQQRLREVEQAYLPAGSDTASSVQITWRDLAGQRELHTQEDVEEVLSDLRDKLLALMQQHRSIIVD